MDHDVFIFRYPEPDGGFPAFRFVGGPLFRSQVPAFAHVPGHFPLGGQGFPFRFQFFRGAVAVIGLAFCQQLVSVFL